MSEDKLKHLEFIQDVISRQAANTFQVKAWAIGLLAVITGLSRTTRNDIFLAGLGIVVLFWILDAYYLSKERKFRALYDKVRVQKNTDFSMDISKFRNFKCTWPGCLFAVPIYVLFGAMLLGIILFRFVWR